MFKAFQAATSPYHTRPPTTTLPLDYPRLRDLIRLSRVEEETLRRLLVEDTEITAGTLEVAAVAADPTDNMILACAVEGHADDIGSGDTDLLSLREYTRIPIITARAFLDVLEAERHSSGS